MKMPIHHECEILKKTALSPNIQNCLKGTVSRGICHVPQSTDPHPKAVSNINSNSPISSNWLLIPRCGPSRGIGLFLQARADLKHECYRPWAVCSTVRTFFVDCPFKGNSMLSKNIRTIPRCGSRSCGEGHTVGFDPAGGATSESPIPW
jgi:hypothetical protein